MDHRRKKLGVKNRITPERLKEAYEKTGLEPHFTSLTPIDGRVSPLGALLLVARPGRGGLWERIHVPGAYGEGFYFGFINWKATSPTGLYQLGYQDGLEARKALIGYR
jgi:hypothetical protein